MASFSALADPTRRAVLDLLRQGPRCVGEIAECLPVSQPAVSQHLAVLLEAGLVAVRRDGRRRVYRVRPEGLEEIRAWVESFWTDALESFRASIDGDPETGGRE